MKAAVVGPGAMGCLFAARLAQGGVDTTLVDHCPERAARLQETGLHITGPKGTIDASVETATRIPDDTDLTLVCVKSHSNGTLRFPDKTIVLTLQQGLGNVEALAEAGLDANRLLAGATEEAAEKLSENTVRHLTSGQTRFGPWIACSTSTAEATLVKAGFDIRVTQAPGQTVWEQTAITAGIAPLCAILGVPNGRLLEIAEMRQLMRDLVVEAVKVASSEGYRFKYSLIEKAESVIEATRDHLSPMLRDLREGKRTELDAISGEILRRAQLAALSVPRTRVVYQLVKGLEKR